jgi:peptide/nickel transport system substrate-binding protein
MQAIALIVIIVVAAVVVYAGYYMSSKPAPPPINQPPVAIAAGSKLLVNVGEAITFNSEGSHDPDGQIVNYLWDFGDGSQAQGATVTHSYALPGRYIVVLTVFDDGGLNATNDVQLISVEVSEMLPAPSLDNPPVAIFSASKDIVLVNESVTLDGSSSYGWKERYGEIRTDPTKIVAYNWSFGDGFQAQGAIVNHSYASPGSYMVKLTVYLENGKNSASARTIRVTSSGVTTGIIKNPDTYIFASDIEPQQLDPVRETGSAGRALMLNLGDTLLRYASGDVVPRPSLAESYSISEDGKQWNFTLRHGVKFWDGSELTAYDVEYTFQRWLAINYPTGEVEMFVESLTGYAPGELIPNDVIANAVKALDNYTIQFNFQRSNGAFMTVVARPVFVILNKNFAIAHGSWFMGDTRSWTGATDERMASGEAFMATGPYKVVSFSRNEKLRATRFDNYWRGPASIKNFELIYVPEFSTRAMMLSNGDVDAISVSSVTQAQQMQGKTDTMLYQGQSGFTECIYFGFNIDLAKQPTGVSGVWSDFFHDIHLRRAFAYAFPYKTYIEQAYLNLTKQARGYLPEGSFGYYPFYNFTYDPDKARTEFQQAWGGSVWENGFTLVFGYQLFAKDQSLIAYQLLAESLHSINPKFNLIVQEGTWPTLLYWTLFQAYEQNSPDPLYLNFNYHTGWEFPSYTEYSNSTIDALLDAAESETNVTKRAELYQDAQILIGEDVPCLITVYDPAFYAAKTYISGYYFQPAWQIWLGYVYDLRKA